MSKNKKVLQKSSKEEVNAFQYDMTELVDKYFGPFSDNKTISAMNATMFPALRIVESQCFKLGIYAAAIDGHSKQDAINWARTLVEKQVKGRQLGAHQIGVDGKTGAPVTVDLSAAWVYRVVYERAVSSWGVKDGDARKTLLTTAETMAGHGYDSYKQHLEDTERKKIDL